MTINTQDFIILAIKGTEKHILVFYSTITAQGFIILAIIGIQGNT